jgi:AcrR family transcriptional regulator
MQRARILHALVAVVAEVGVARATVTAVCADAAISRRTFYAVFESLEDCFLAMMDDGYRRVDALIADAFVGERSWQDGVRNALAALLAMFDEQPVLARVWLVETLAAGPRALERRKRHIAALTRTIVARWPAPEGVELNALAATAAMESVLGIIHTRVLSGPDEPLVELLGPLAGLVTTLYLGPGAAANEIERGETFARASAARRQAQSRSGVATATAGVPPALRNPRAHRARACVLYLAQHPGSSNRQVAQAVGIPRHDQMSRLLARLAGMGLLVKHEGLPGRPNAWFVSPSGRQAAIALQDLCGSDVS